MFTNTVPVDAYRGAGRPEAAYLLERLVDVAAREMKIDRIELRRRIARQIYDDPLFWHAAHQPEPPIHVIVRNGDVALEGVVGTPVQKQKAGIIARSAFGVFDVENNLRVD